MIPRTISASALKTANCMARFKAEYVQGGRGPGGPAADLGTTCHLALEKYVQATVVHKTQPQDVNVLMSCYMMAYLQVMNNMDLQSDAFKDGEQMLRTWHARQDFEGIEVLSCEVKDSFELPYRLPDGTTQKMKCNYICDRVDKIGDATACDCPRKCPKEIRVVDYKTWRNLIDANEVKAEIQAKIYSLAYRIKYPHVVRIWIIIDQLRGEEVGSCFTRDDDIVSYKAMKALLQAIVDTPADRARETLNDECGFCVRKAKCKTLRKHDEVGGVLDMNLDELIKLQYEISTANSARKKLVEDVNEQINKKMDELGLTSLDTLDEEYELSTGGTRGGRRHVDESRFPLIVGSEIALELAEYGIKKIDALQHDPRVTPDTWKQIQEIVWTSPGRRQVRVKRKKPKEE